MGIATTIIVADTTITFLIAAVVAGASAAVVVVVVVAVVENLFTLSVLYHLTCLPRQLCFGAVQVQSYP